MSDEANWQASNARYLAAALAWLRAKLERRAEQGQESLVITTEEPAVIQAESPVEASIEARPPLKGKRKARDAQAAAAEPSQPDAVSQRAADLAAAESQTPVPALIVLARRLGLSSFERNVLLLCAAMELDTSIASLCARAQPDPLRPYPTFALALTLFDTPTWDALSPERPLRYWRLIEINQPHGQPLTGSALRADERIVSYLKGLNYLDDRLVPLLSSLAAPADKNVLPPSQQRLADRICDRLKQTGEGENLPAIQLLGIDTASKQLVAAQAAAELRLHVYRLPASLLPTQASELETLARLWQREGMLLPIALYLDGIASDPDASLTGLNSSVTRLVSRISGVVFLDTRDVLPGLIDNILSVDVAKPTPAEQKEAWAAAMGKGAGATPAQLASQFNLSAVTIYQLASRAMAEPAPKGSSLHERLWSACLASTRPRLDTLAQRIDARATWKDIVLPPEETRLLQQIAAQVAQRSTVHESWGFANKMNRGLGISALLCGDPGTGKTMAAEVIANELHLNLYRIDLSAVVSKYIGETEKNLRRVFEAAEDGGAILFFDEADALFGKRSEVKDSHDRYANIEINYLLQRMETYGGLAILATNRQSSLDPAFMRRLRFVVNFPFPAHAQRKAMWENAFPKETPTQELDLDRLARLNLTGGNITNIALNAAFQAAHSGAPVTTPLLVESARTELKKLGRVINELEFRSTGRAGRVA
jgi:hypothetical protein